MAINVLLRCGHAVAKTRRSFRELKAVVQATRHLSTGAATPINDVSEHQATALFMYEPFVIRGLVKSWPALSKWAGGAAFRAHADTVVPVEVSPTGSHSYLDPSHEVASLPLGMFTDYVFTATPEQRAAMPRLYLAQHTLLDQLPGLKADVPTPGVLHSIVAGGHRLLLNAWIGPPGISSPPHRDPYHNLYCVIAGSKYVRLWSAVEYDRMYPSTDPHQGNTSTVDDVRSPGPAFPEFSAVPYQETVLGPGDALHIPRNWWHYVEGDGQHASIAVSHWWDPPIKQKDKAGAAGAATANTQTKAQPGPSPSLGPAPTSLSREGRVRHVPRPK